MSIDDVNYMKQNSIKQSYTFLVDSSDRDRTRFPSPSEYSIEFTIPFKNVIGLEVLDVSVPKTMYNIDSNNNLLYYYIHDISDTSNIDTSNIYTSNIDTNNVTILTDDLQNEYYDTSKFSVLEIPPGDYTTNSFIDKVRLLFFQNNINMDFAAVDYPAELTNRIYFQSSKPFILDMHRSTIAEVLGFDLYTNNNNENKSKYKYNNSYNHKKGFEKLFHSISNSNGFHILQSPGMMYLIGYKYIILKCPEIEQHLYRSLSYSKYNLGLAKIRVNSYGYNDEKTSFLKVPLREFHPIGKLSKLTFRFETNTGQLYDFKGVNHNVVFAIYYYEPRQDNIIKDSILNPEYDPNLMNYLYTQQEQEGESDEENEEYSRDDIGIYKKREKEFNKSGIENDNKFIAFKNKQMNDLKYSQKDNLIKKIKNKNITLQSKLYEESSSYEDSDDYTD